MSVKDEDKKATEGAPPTPGSGAPSNPPPSQPNVGPRSGPEHQPPPAKPPAPRPGPPPKPAPKNPGFVTVTVDGREVVAKPGTNMIQAAKEAGANIPYYCWHPRMSVAANCRMCLVQVSNAPKLVPACQTPLVEGQVITTVSDKVKDSQRAVQEFLLLNHPVDCAICDKAGECKLQDYYMQHDHQPSRLEGHKVQKGKRKVLGPRVTIDQERCIMCTRCVRFMDEIAHEPQLGMFGRGSHEWIDVFPGTELDSNYSMNTVDVCPVGALTSRDFRFRARAWFLSAAPSVCTGCSRGCNIYADFHGQETYRYRPRENEEINKSWLCDHGRLSYKYLDKDRVVGSTLGRAPESREVTPSEAVKEAWTRLSPLVGTPGLAVVASPVASNEDLLASLSFAKEVLKVSEVFVSGRPEGKGDHFLMTADKNPNRKGLEWIAAGLGLALQPFDALVKAVDSGKVKALWAVGAEVPVDAQAFAQTAQKLELFVLQAFNEGPLTQAAHVLFAAAPHVEDEGSFTNVDGIVQRFRAAYPARGESRPHWKWVSDLFEAAGEATRYESAREVFQALSPRVPELSSFNWDENTPSNRVKPGINPLPTGADGRPPGYREFGAPRVRGI